ncbi:sensor histidine kinase [Acidimangrovimonas sediminis]|uniref:sensor histidine kinase n=1 Tax=Acidimangrovimonas sediminis TaxID=2056283 RepID=UPI000C7FD819|nr:sensor histidine kinase [Acidimangrovimonas sediminis]
MAEALPADATWSLKRRVGLGVLALLLLGGLVAAVAAFAYGKTAARESYDRLLLGAANDIAEAISIHEGQPVVDLPVAAFQLLALAPDDRIWYTVRGPMGHVLTGEDGALPNDLAPGKPSFFDGRMNGAPARFVSLPRRFAERAFSGTIRVTVGQTLRARRAMALGLTRDALVAAALGGVLLLVLALVVVARALRPLAQVAEGLAARDPHDLTPMQTAVPAEAAVMVGAMNRFMGRLDRQVGTMRNLISDTAHQLRTPVAALRVQAELAAEEPDAARRAQMLSRLQRRTRSLGELLDQMLSRALVIHRTDAARRVVVDLRDVALDVIEGRDHELVAPGREVVLEIGEDPVEIMGDALSLSEAAKNLLGNALRHGAGAVRIGAGFEGGRAVLWVEDSGPGPAPEVLARIGERFEKNAASTGESAGLGLSIARQVAEAYGGSLVLRPVPRGFRAALVLPGAGA